MIYTLLGSRVVLQLFMLAVRTINQKKTYVDNSSSCFNKLQHYNNYLTCHSDINIVCHQPIFQYAMPLLGGIKTYVTFAYDSCAIFTAVILGL